MGPDVTLLGLTGRDRVAVLMYVSFGAPPGSSATPAETSSASSTASPTRQRNIAAYQRIAALC